MTSFHAPGGIVVEPKVQTVGTPTVCHDALGVVGGGETGEAFHSNQPTTARMEPWSKSQVSTMRDAGTTLQCPSTLEIRDGETPTLLRPPRLRWSAADWETSFLVLALKGLVLIAAALGVGTLFDQYESWHTLWNRWDATHYLTLAENGYSATGDGRFSIVFYPLYPWLVRGVAFICQSYFGATLLVSGVASICAALLLRRLVELDQPAKVARLSVWFLLIFPTAYFLHIGYTESLFLALVVGCLLAARMQFWALAGMLGALACLTRVNGLLLLPTLLVEAWLQYRVTRRINWRWLWIAVTGFGFAGYLLLNYRVTGDPFAFSTIMEDHWYKKLTPPWVGIYDAWGRIPRFNLQEGLFEFVFIVFSFLCTVWCWIKLRPSYAVWITLNWLLITSTTFVVSVPRYCLTLFPIFIILASLAVRRPLVGRIVTAISLLLLSLFAIKFAHGTWAF